MSCLTARPKRGHRNGFISLLVTRGSDEPPPSMVPFLVVELLKLRFLSCQVLGYNNRRSLMECHCWYLDGIWPSIKTAFKALDSSRAFRLFDSGLPCQVLFIKWIKRRLVGCALVFLGFGKIDPSPNCINNVNTKIRKQKHKNTKPVCILIQ